MGALNPQGIHQAHAVPGHIGQGVGHVYRQAQASPQHQADGLGDMGIFHFFRQADVPVVEANHAEATAGKFLAHCQGPAQQLGAQAHHQYHGGVVGLSELLVGQANAIGADVLFRHVRQYSYASFLANRNQTDGFRLNPVWLPGTSILSTSSNSPSCTDVRQFTTPSARVNMAVVGTGGRTQR